MDVEFYLHVSAFTYRATLDHPAPHAQWIEEDPRFSDVVSDARNVLETGGRCALFAGT